MKKIFSFLSFLFLFPIFVEAARLTEEQSYLISRYIEEAAAEQNLEVALIRSIISVESAFNYRAVSKAGAKGLMQIMPLTAKNLGEPAALDPSNPRANIRTGTLLLRRLINYYKGDLKLALAAYNAGVKAVKRYNGIPPYAETQKYVKKVLRRLNLERRKRIQI